jgi:hypothetical protein
MKSMKQWLLVAGVASLIGMMPGSLLAQGQKGGDPAQFQQRRMDRFKEQLEVKDDAEWDALKPLVEKVSAAQQAAFADRIRGAMGGGRQRGGGDNSGDQNGGNRRSGMFGTPSPEFEALQKAIEAKASKSELKAALDKYQTSRKEKQAALEKAQEDLRKVLSSRQEAIATLNGLL